MVNEEVIFDNFMKGYGGIYIPSSRSVQDIFLSGMLDVMRQHIASVRHSKPSLPEVSIYYVDNMGINACAFLADSKYFIAINIGAVMQLQEVFEKITLSDKLYDNKIFLTCNKNIYGPKLLYFGMIFLVMHEYSHIRFGHSGLINYLYGDSITEMMRDCLINDGIFRQTLEYDADNCAIANLINRILLCGNSETSFNEISEDIGLCSLATYIIFRLFDEGKHRNYENYDLDELSKSTHPRPGIRMNYIMANICSILDIYYNDKQVAQIAQKMIDYIRVFEEALNKEISIYKLEIGIAYTQKGNEHVKRIHNNWEHVRKQLEPYTHDELAHFEKLEFESILID